MRGGAGTTRENWRTLQRLAALHLSTLRREHPDWDLETLQRHLNLPTTKLLAELAKEAGFEGSRALFSRQENKILRAMLQGILCPERIAMQARVSLEAVKKFLSENQFPYGSGTYGQVHWGGTAKEALDELPLSQPRSVSRKGQFSYKGRLYSLGASYAGSPCWIREAGERLLIHCPGRGTLTLRKR